MATTEKPAALAAALKLQLYQQEQNNEQPPAGKFEVHGKPFVVSQALAEALRSQKAVLTASDGAVVQNVAVGSTQHQEMLSISFGMSVEEAQTIIRERDANNLAHDYSTYVKAKNMLRQLTQLPRITSNKTPWQRERRYED